MSKIDITLFIALMFIFSHTHSIFAIDYSEDHDFSNETLEQLIEIRVVDNNYDVVEVQNMIDRISVIPERLLSAAVKSGVALILMDYPLTDLEEFSDLSGIVPPGWEDTGLTWDDVPGAGGYTAAARIGYSNPGVGHSSINLEYHELAHSLDSYLTAEVISDTEEFRILHAEEKESMFPGDVYFNNVGEYFAEVLGYYYLSDETRAELKANAPGTYAFLDSLSTRVLGIDERTATSVNLTWELTTSAVEYGVYRNNDLIATVSGTNYQDTDLERLGFYVYYVSALDHAGEVIQQTYKHFVDGMDAATSEDPERQVPDMPKNLVVDIDNYTSVVLTWDAAVNADSYMILRDGTEITTATDLLFVDRDLDEETTYAYTIVAFNDAGESEGSIIEMTTGIKPEDPTNKGVLSNPATNTYPFLLIVVVLLAVGGASLVIYNRKNRPAE